MNMASYSHSNMAAVRIVQYEPLNIFLVIFVINIKTMK